MKTQELQCEVHAYTRALEHTAASFEPITSKAELFLRDFPCRITISSTSPNSLKISLSCSAEYPPLPPSRQSHVTLMVLSISEASIWWAVPGGGTDKFLLYENSGTFSCCWACCLRILAISTFKRAATCSSTTLAFFSISCACSRSCRSCIIFRRFVLRWFSFCNRSFRKQSSSS